MTIAENLAIVERFDNLITAADIDELEELCTPDMRNHALAPDRPQGLAGTHEFLTRSAMQFGDTGWSKRQVIADDEFVVHHGKRGGTWRGGSLFGFDLHPGSYSRDVVFLYRLQNGRITDRWAVRDDLTMLRQLGAL
jgi:predicted ester cyclase